MSHFFCASFHWLDISDKTHGRLNSFLRKVENNVASTIALLDNFFQCFWPAAAAVVVGYFLLFFFFFLISVSNCPVPRVGSIGHGLIVQPINAAATRRLIVG